MLLPYSNATVESRILTLTNSTNFSIDRALYKSKIPTKAPNSSYVYRFSTSFIFSQSFSFSMESSSFPQNLMFQFLITLYSNHHTLRITMREILYRKAN
ncbi:L-type lectin-domain containing receptor kinase VII.1 [Prunus yedoensis var. nudiflora]|uniref:L-type lectin-domain containing receptor kinase VII.1 n=1 Tax=Prunus yedoensis var. nudiflora TaxID=2094558 RepID=A0A314YNZ3_PRUYE|nr:L-type lectin-domain containing receptor kinase VII.1 [Prunus yedoensis var. nudiflora]